MRARVGRLPAGVWMLGLVSLFMDTSSELIHALLPVFLVGALGVSALTLGWIEGVAEGVASFMKLASGAASDRMRRRKTLVVLGYGLAAASKPLFPLADSAATVMIARVTDRVGKGIRGAPRDALIVDLTDPAQRGAAFGLRQALDTVGAFLGPLLAIALMLALAGDVRAVLAWAIVPALAAVVILLFFVREPERHAAAAPQPRFDAQLLRQFPPAFWVLLAVTVPFTLARFSEAFLLLRARDAVADAWTPLTLVAMNVAYAITAYPAGRLSDRVPRARLLMLGCAVLIAADLALAAGGAAWIFAGVVLWGLHMGLTEGLIAALVADYAPRRFVGTAFGAMHFTRGVLLVAASVLAGALWTHGGAALTFGAGAGFSLVALLALLALPQRQAQVPAS